MTPDPQHQPSSAEVSKVHKLTLHEAEKPSIGRNVHYVMLNGQHRPAVIVRLIPGIPGKTRDSLNLQVFTDRDSDATSNLTYRRRVEFDPSGTCPGTWHWPERV